MKKIIIMLILSSLILSGCGVVEDKSSSSEPKVTETKVAVSEKNEKAAGSVTDPFTDEYYCNPYLKVRETDEWKKGFSDEKTAMFHSTLDERCSVGFGTDDSEDHLSADASAAEILADYKSMGYKLIKNEKAEIAGCEAFHILFLAEQDLYYEYYFYEYDDVLYDIAIIQDIESYDLYRDKEEEFISMAEFTYAKNKEHVSETEQKNKPDRDKSSDSWNFTIEDIYNANKNNSVFQYCNNIKTSMTIYDIPVLLYAENNFTYIYAEDYCEGTIEDRTCCFEGRKYYTEFSLDSQNENMYEKAYFIDNLFSNLVISDVREDGEDLVITAQLNEFDTAYLLYDYDMDLEPENGDIAVAKLRVNANNLLIEENTVEIVNGSNSYTFITASNEYNCEMPAQTKPMYEHMNLPDKRTITLIVNPGSESEYTISTSGIKGDEIQFVSTTDFSTKIDKYEDKECTIGYTTQTDADKNADLVIYGKVFGS